MAENFNSHARVGRDALEALRLEIVGNFNSHARVGRDMAAGEAGIHQAADFNSHARVGRDNLLSAPVTLGRISTHTPV